MAGWADLFGKDNGFQQYVAGNRGKLAAIGAGLGSGRSFGSGLANAAQMLPQGALVDNIYEDKQTALAQKEGEKNATIELMRAQGFDDLIGYLEAGGDMTTAANETFKRMQPGYGASEAPRPIEINGQLVDPTTGNVIGDYRDPQGGPGSTEYGLTPIYGQFEDGTYGMGVVGKDGTFKQVDTGELQVFDPRTLASERAAGGALGKAGGEATAAAPGDIAAGEAALSVLDQIEQSPELGWATGTSAGLGGNNVPGTGRFDFQNLVDQAKSGAFLIAVQQMRGLGALSNAEGGAATQAITRMNTATSTEAFKKALADYRAVIETGMQRARSRIGGGQQAPREYTFNPATGRLE